VILEYFILEDSSFIKPIFRETFTGFALTGETNLTGQFFIVFLPV
jgi:hypothetical protein